MLIYSMPVAGADLRVQPEFIVTSFNTDKGTLCLNLYLILLGKLDSPVSGAYNCSYNVDVAIVA